MANPLYDQKMISEFERVLGSELEYCHETAIVTNTSGATINLLGIPYPVKLVSAGVVEVMTALETQTPANIYGFLVTNRKEEILNGATSMAEYAVLTNGCAVVSKEAFVQTDPAGAAYADADFETFCADASPFIKVSDSTSALVSTPYYL